MRLLEQSRNGHQGSPCASSLSSQSHLSALLLAQLRFAAAKDHKGGGAKAIRLSGSSGDEFGRSQFGGGGGGSGRQSVAGERAYMQGGRLSELVRDLDTRNGSM